MCAKCMDWRKATAKRMGIHRYMRILGKAFPLRPEDQAELLSNL